MDIFAWRIIKDGNSAVELRPRGVLKQGFSIYPVSVSSIL